jgi:hypothetical protein
VKHTAMRNAIAALMEQLAPRGSHVLITGGLPDGASPPEGPRRPPASPLMRRNRPNRPNGSRSGAPRRPRRQEPSYFQA